MEFDESGIPTIESLLFLEESERLVERSDKAWRHNLAVQRLNELGEHIAEHCLEAVAIKRSLLTQEGALNVSIVDFLKASGFSTIDGDSNQRDWLHYVDEDGKSVAERVPRKLRNGESICDILVDPHGDRIEIKTSAYATSKNKISSEFFDKDLNYLQRHEFEDFETFPWEGVPREHRGAEVAILAVDKPIAVRSKKLKQLVGDISGDETKRISGGDGVTYVVRTGTYAVDQILNVVSARPRKIEKFVVVVAIPSARDGT